MFPFEGYRSSHFREDVCVFSPLSMLSEHVTFNWNMIGKSSEYAPIMKWYWNDELRLVRWENIHWMCCRDKRSSVAGRVVANMTTFLEACVHKKRDSGSVNEAKDKSHNGESHEKEIYNDQSDKAPPVEQRLLALYCGFCLYCLLVFPHYICTLRRN